MINSRKLWWCGACLLLPILGVAEHAPPDTDCPLWGWLHFYAF